MSVPQSDLKDPALLAEVDLARAAAQAEAGEEQVGDHVDVHIEDEAAVTHLFEADKTGYRGWRWAVTVTSAGPDTDVTISEVVLLPGPDALVAPEWVPWEDRVRAGDLGVGDLLPTAPDDSRLVPAYLASDDPAVEEVARETGLGRSRVLSRPGRLEAATRWQHGEFGPRSDMARSAPGRCGTCGFYLPLAGTLRAAFGTCGNEIAPADGHVVHVEYGCGAHSEAEVEQVSPVLVADLIYDDAQLDVEPLATPTPEPAVPPKVSKPAAEPADATTPEPVAGSVARTDSAPIAEPAPLTEPEPTVKVDAATELEATTQPAPAGEPEAVAKPEAAAESEAVAAEPEAVAEPAPAAESGAVAEPEAAAESEAVAEPEAVAESEAVAEPEAVAESEVAAESEPVAEPEATTQSAPTAEPEVAAESAAPGAGPAVGTAEPVAAPAADQDESAAPATTSVESVAAPKDFTVPEAIAGPAAKPPAPAASQPEPKAEAGSPAGPGAIGVWPVPDPAVPAGEPAAEIEPVVTSETDPPPAG